MIARAALALVLCALGCESGGRYLVDEKLWNELRAPPRVVRMNLDERRSGGLVINLRCVGQGSARSASRYAGVVEGDAGWWRFEMEAPPDFAREAPCDDPQTLDAIAELAARRYRLQRGAVAAERATDGKEVHVRLLSLRAATATPAAKGKVSVEARNLNGPMLAAIILGSVGTLTAAVGGLYFATPPGNCGDNFACGVFTGWDRQAAILDLIVGGVLLAHAIGCGIWARLSHPPEVRDGNPTRLYYEP